MLRDPDLGWGAMPCSRCQQIARAHTKALSPAMHASPPTASAPRIALLRVARGEPSSSCAARKVKEPAAKPLSSDSTSAAPWRPWEEVGRGSEWEEEVGRGGEWEE